MGVKIDFSLNSLQFLNPIGWFKEHLTVGEWGTMAAEVWGCGTVSIRFEEKG